MMGLAQIRDENSAQARKARRMELEPLVYNGNPETLKKIPFFGDYRASKFGWKMTKVYLVDSSGLGAENESALTFSQFVNEAVIGKGYAIIEAGQFQVYIGEFSKRGQVLKSNKRNKW